MGRDEDRLRRIKSYMEEAGLDIIIVFDEVHFRYITGGLVDYSASFITNDNTIAVISPVMEGERARMETWADEVYTFSRTGGDGVITAKNIYEAVSRIVKGYKRIGLIYDKISYSAFNEFKSYLDNSMELIDVSRPMSLIRSIKSRVEIENIKKAIQIVEAGLKTCMDNVDVGMTERDLAIKALVEMKAKGADKVLDELIVASGERSALPHGRASSRRISYGEPITMDYVASFNSYWGDITRTMFIGGIQDEFRKIYEVVYEAQQAALDSLREGVEAGIIDESARNVIRRAGYGKYFTHGTGHGIGLEVHEYPRLSRDSRDKLIAGMVVTIEPGIYINDLGGVRIEDDVLILKDGYMVLSSLSREILIKGV